eukprot:353630-Chlamydomonas_euryale.AAC.3
MRVLNVVLGRLLAARSVDGYCRAAGDGLLVASCELTVTHIGLCRLLASARLIQQALGGRRHQRDADGRHARDTAQQPRRRVLVRTQRMWQVG